MILSCQLGYSMELSPPFTGTVWPFATRKLYIVINEMFIVIQIDFNGIFDAVKFFHLQIKLLH